jgi:hypothetical protein
MGHSHLKLIAFSISWRELTYSAASPHFIPEAGLVAHNRCDLLVKGTK